MTARSLSLLPLVVLLAVGCSDAAEDPNGSPGAGGSGATSGSGGSVAGSAAGGQFATGGGSGTLAGSSGTGTSTGGASAGGSPSSGGSPVGGSSAGGSSFGGCSGGSLGTAGTSAQGGGAALDGKGLYDANCKTCHGEQGAGSTDGPDIMHPVRDYSSWVVRNGRAQTTFPKPMEKYGTDKLSDAQLMLIFDYLDQPLQPTTGQALYDDYCANCHGKDGKGGPTQRPITNEVSKVTTIVRAGKNAGKFSMRRDYMPAFPATDISDAELMLIKTYVDSL